MSNKVIIGVDYGNYSFNAALKQVTLSGVTTVSIEQFLLIVNLTTQDIIYSPVKVGKGGTVNGSVITLDFDTVLMANTDELQVHFALDNTTDTSLLKVELNQDISNLNQYTQIELLNLMYEELQLQTKLLKKIYT